MIGIVSVSDRILPSISTMGLTTLIFSNAMVAVTVQFASRDREGGRQVCEEAEAGCADGQAGRRERSEQLHEHI
jgi:hypothetical protein